MAVLPDKQLQSMLILVSASLRCCLLWCDSHFYVIGNLGEIFCHTRKNPASQDSPHAAGRVSDIYISAAVRSLGELFIL